MYNTVSEPQCKLWHLGDNEVSLQVLSCNKCTTVVQDIDSVGGCKQGDKEYM